MLSALKLKIFFPGGYLTKVCTGRLRPEVQPLTLSYTILAEKVPLLYTFYWKKVPLSHTYFRKSCSSFHVVLNKWTSTTFRDVYSENYNIKGPFKYLNDRFPYPFMYLNLWNPYPFLYLKPEKGTPFGQSLPVYAIIGSTPLPRDFLSIWFSKRT